MKSFLRPCIEYRNCLFTSCISKSWGSWDRSWEKHVQVRPTFSNVHIGLTWCYIRILGEVFLILLLCRLDTLLCLEQEGSLPLVKPCHTIKLCDCISELVHITTLKTVCQILQIPQILIWAPLLTEVTALCRQHYPADSTHSPIFSLLDIYFMYHAIQKNADLAFCWLVQKSWNWHTAYECQ